jgi:hypothetical protein
MIDDGAPHAIEDNDKTGPVKIREAEKDTTTTSDKIRARLLIEMLLVE